MAMKRWWTEPEGCVSEPGFVRHGEVAIMTPVSVVVDTTIVILTVTGGRNGGGLTSIVPWRLAIVRVPP